MLYLFKFRKVTDSRWCTAGPACKALVAGLAVGLGGLVDLIRQDPTTSDWYMKGFSRLSAAVR
eukprot:7400111-Heterocapsa_arctica.AAC.1